MAGVVGATPVTIANPSFETDSIQAGSDYTTFLTNNANGGAPSGWTGFNDSGGNFVVNGNSQTPRFSTFADGSQANELLVAPNAGGNVIYQFLSSNFAPNTTYTLSGAEGFDATAVGQQTDAGGKLELYGSNDGYAAPLVTITFPGGSSPVGSFRSGSDFFTTPATGGATGGTILVRIEGFSSPTTYSFSGWDNIRLDAVAVPEPVSASLLAAGAGVMLLSRGRRRPSA
jgi:hypothetical protein